MRGKSRLAFALAGLTLVAAFGAAGSRAGTALVVTGHGWGHGVGMSQWGAYGYARHGWSYQRILRHYYPGTKLGHAGEPYVRVLLVERARLVTVGCAARMKVTDGKRLTRKLAPGTYGVGPKLVLPVRRDGTGRSFGRHAVFLCDRAPLTLDGRPYHGSLFLRSDGRRLSVVDVLRLDAYVSGVVPSESPSHWPLAELEAQAVAARSYALSELRPDSWYDLLPDDRDQVYGGVAAERPHSDKAVAATRGQVLLWDGQVARTYYSSSSGGRTEAVQDAWPGSSPVPYLRSVPDPWDVYSPHHSWGPYALSAQRLARRLGLGSPVDSVRVERDSSWRVLSVRFRLASGVAARRSGDQVERALHLRSTWFSIGVLRLWASGTRVVYGRRVRLVARAIDAKGTVLQQRDHGGWWHTVRHVHHGRATLLFRPRASTAFRLLLEGTSGTSLDVAVAPRVHVQPLGARLLAGKVLPRTTAPVRIWLRGHRGWRIVARPTLNAKGAFRTRMRLRPSLYRVTVGADGVLAGTEKTLRVTRRQLAAFRR